MPSLADDRDEIRDLYARYCLLLDTGGDPVEWAELYTDDGVFLGAGDRVAGRASLEAYARRIIGGAGHRLVVNHVIDVDGDVATCRASVIITAGGAVASSGRTTDELRRVAGRWRIAHRSFVPDGAPSTA